jgi:hypothetical protein
MNFSKFSSLLLLLLLTSSLANAQITLTSFKKLASWDRTYITDFVIDNGYQIQSSTKCDIGSETIYVYNKNISKNSWKRLFFVSNRKMVAWMTTDYSSFLTQRNKLLGGNYSIVEYSEQEIGEKYCADLGCMDSKSNPDSSFNLGIFDSYLLEGGYLMLSVPANDEVIGKTYMILLFHPEICNYKGNGRTSAG